MADGGQIILGKFIGELFYMEGYTFLKEYTVLHEGIYT